MDVHATALALVMAEDQATAIDPLTALQPELDADQAYEIQDRALQLRLDRGERVVGIKLGLTSPAKQQRMNVNEPLVAWLTDRMLLTEGQQVPVGSLIHPRVEPEIVLEMGEPLVGPGVTATDALKCVRSVRAGLEVIDSRYRDYRFTLPDVIADNASSAHYVLGESVSDRADVDLRDEACVLERNGEQVSRGVGADVLGDPLEALVFAANLLGRRGLRIERDWVVLTGGITDATPLHAGDGVRAGFSTLGSVALWA